MLIAASDPLAKYEFQPDEKAAMSWLLNLYYRRCGYRMKLIHASDTANATHVASFVAVVQRHNPLKI